jgi:putative transposase
MPTFARKHQLADSLVYHVYHRSSNRMPIFHREDDYQRFRALLEEYHERFAIKLYHWAIMQNHFHLLLEIEDPERLSSAMAGLLRRYTHYHHTTYNTAGYLWQGRFKSQPVQKEEYMIACGRYIERNPVKAGIVVEAYEYPFSSARYYCCGAEDNIITEDPCYKEYARDKKEREEEYREFLRDFDSAQDRRFDAMEKPVGGEEFLRRLVQLNGRLVSCRRGKPRNINCASI